MIRGVGAVIVRLAAVVPVSSILACGGGGSGGGAGGGGGSGGGGTTEVGGATCSSNASCGGEIVGTWAIVQACNIKTSMSTGCAERTYSVSDPAQTGTMVFRVDGSVTERVTTTGTITASFPPSCLATSGETCADTDASFRNLVQTGTLYTSASCADDAGACVCTLAFHTTSDVSGRYITSGSTLTAGTQTASYCVTGSTLIISWPNAAGEPPTVVVYTRQ